MMAIDYPLVHHLTQDPQVTVVHKNVLLLGQLAGNYLTARCLLQTLLRHLLKDDQADLELWKLLLVNHKIKEL